jgi:inhibitor of KinA
VTVPRIVPIGDSAVVVEFDARIDPHVNDRAVSLAARMREAGIPGVRDVVPTYRSVAVYFDPLRTSYDELLARLEGEALVLPAPRTRPDVPMRIPVCYGGDFGPDLETVAAHARMNAADVIALHARVTYRVFMLGFAPGFAYLGIVDKRIAAPRRATPRVRVPAGSVGLAGQQTGVYPAAAPGGWQLIGRTPVRPFRLDMPSPFLFSPGDAVEFVPIGRDEYDRLVRLEEITSTAESNESAEKKSVHQTVEPDRPAR